MTRTGPDTDELLERSRAGDDSARGALLERHRGRLHRLVSLRLDPRLAGRIDPSDVVQEVLAEASARLDDYLRRPPLPFYPWLRQIAVDRLIEQHRRHVQAGQRSIGREVAEQSAAELAEQLVGHEDTPSAAARRKETQERVRAALAALSEQEREVVVLRYLEQLSSREVAAVLGISEAAAKKRALRALQRLRESLQGEESGGSS